MWWHFPHCSFSFIFHSIIYWCVGFWDTCLGIAQQLFNTPHKFSGKVGNQEVAIRTTKGILDQAFVTGLMSHFWAIQHRSLQFITLFFASERINLCQLDSQPNSLVWLALVASSDIFCLPIDRRSCDACSFTLVLQHHCLIDRHLKRAVPGGCMYRFYIGQNGILNPHHPSQWK